MIVRSPLNGSIDPKAFLMMLNAQFPVLFRGGKVHLTPLWDALAAAGHKDDDLVGLFVMFQEAAEKLGFPVAQIEVVSALTREQRQVQKLRYHGTSSPNGAADPSGLTPLIEIEPAPSVDGGDDGLGDLNILPPSPKPFISDDLRRRVNQAVVQSIRTTPISAHVESAQIGFWVDANFEELCDGARFEFAAMLNMLGSVKGVTTVELYVVARRLEELLAQNNVAMTIPELSVDMNEAAAMLAQVTGRRSSPSDPRAPSLRPPPRGETPHDPKAPRTLEEQLPALVEAAGKPEKQRRLAKWGLGRSRLDGKGRFIRPAVLALAIAGIATFAWLNRPDRPLDLEPYGVVFPMHDARLVNGTFQGTIHEASWRKLTYKQREAAVSALESIIREQGLISNLQIRDARQRLVITGSGSGKLVASQFLLRDNLPPGDNTAPPPGTPTKPPSKKKPS